MARGPIFGYRFTPDFMRIGIPLNPQPRRGGLARGVMGVWVKYSVMTIPTDLGPLTLTPKRPRTHAPMALVP